MEIEMNHCENCKALEAKIEEMREYTESITRERNDLIETIRLVHDRCVEFNNKHYLLVESIGDLESKLDLEIPF